MDRKIAFLFAGQGSQYVGMGKEIIENFPEAGRLLTEAGEILGFDLKKICLEGPAQELNNTRNTQPAIYAVSLMISQILQEKGISPAVVTGHSLGEYSALAAARVYSFHDGLRLVRKRGVLMDEALPAGQGTMAAVIGLDEEDVLSICRESEGVCQVANYNSPGQIVISGERSAVSEAMEQADRAGARRVIELKVSGPFHSELMEGAREELAREIGSLMLKKPEIPVIVNVSANYVRTPGEIREALIRQLTNSVHWTESIKLMIRDGITDFIEVGPGRVLTGLVRRINRASRAYNVEDMDGLNKILAEFQPGITV